MGRPAWTGQGMDLNLPQLPGARGRLEAQDPIIYGEPP